MKALYSLLVTIAISPSGLFAQIGMDESVELPGFSARSICHVDGSTYVCGLQASNSALISLNQNLQPVDSLILPTGYNVVGNDESNDIYAYNSRRLIKLFANLSESWSYDISQQDYEAQYHFGKPFLTNEGLCLVPKYHYSQINHGGCTTSFTDSCDLLIFNSDNIPEIVSLDLTYNNALEIRLNTLLSVLNQSVTFSVDIAYFISCNQPVYRLDAGIFTFDLDTGEYSADYVANDMGFNASCSVQDGSIAFSTFSYPQGEHYFTNVNIGEPANIVHCDSSYVAELGVSGELIVALKYGLEPGGKLYKIDEFGAPNLDITSFDPNAWISCFVVADDRVYFVNCFDQENMSKVSKSKRDERRLMAVHPSAFITEPNYQVSQNILLENVGSRPITVDSIMVDGEIFECDIASLELCVGCSTYVNVTFDPHASGFYSDTLRIWANTDVSNTNEPRLNSIPLIGESGPIPAPVTDLSINILPDLSALLTWSPVTQTIYGNPVTPDYYLIFYNEQDPADDSDWYYLTPVVAPGYTHQLVARFRDLMNYRVIAWKGIDPALLGLTPGISFATFQQVSQDMRR